MKGTERQKQLQREAWHRRMADQEKGAALRTIAAERYRANREQMLEYRKARYRTNAKYREDLIARARERGRDPIVNATKHGVRRARKNGAVISAVDLREVLARANGHCAICTKPFDLFGVHFDHIVPLARGGSHGKENLQAVHARCNQSKGTRIAA